MAVGGQEAILRGTTPLHFAAQSGYTAVVDTLLTHGADVKAVDMYDEFTALHDAAKNGQRARPSTRC